MRFWNETRRRSNLHYVEANTDREWLSVGEISSEARSMQIRPSGLQGYYSLTPTSNLICNAPVCRAPVCRTFIEKSEASTVKRSAGFENLLPPIRIERQSVLCKQKNRQNGILD